jgi:uridylate kinase
MHEILMNKAIYKRVLLKLTGEALLGTHTFGFSGEALQHYANQIKEVIALDVQVGIVLGGGNLFRGRSMKNLGIHTITADKIGMLGTVINALAFRDFLLCENVQAVVLAAREIPGIVEGFEQQKAINYLEKGFVVLFAGGTGNPLVSTDSAASLRAIEINANILLKGTNVAGVYNANPATNPHAVLYNHISYDVALQKQLAVMDLAAFSQCRDNKMPIRVFNIFEPDLLKRIVLGESIGTLVSEGE